jgi:triacylglycerol esterase/lipase EstA (alpha/beta hydrolase family)
MPPSDTPPGDERILLVHGFADVHWTPWWDRLEYYLERSGYSLKRVHRMNLGNIPWTTIKDPREYGTKICRKMNELYEIEEQPVDIIAHSMGGLGARWCIQELGGGQQIDDLITLGTPHQGVEGTVVSSNWAQYLVGYVPAGAKALQPGSDLLTTLNRGPLPKSVDFTAVWSKTDYVFILSEWRHRRNGFYPEHLAKQPNVTNLRLPFYEGHLDLISSKRVFKYYRDRLD